jgi:hypothetical protein
MLTKTLTYVPLIRFWHFVYWGFDNLIWIYVNVMGLIVRYDHRARRPSMAAEAKGSARLCSVLGWRPGGPGGRDLGGPRRSPAGRRRSINGGDDFPPSSQAFASELLHIGHWLVIVCFWMLLACSLLHVKSNAKSRRKGSLLLLLLLGLTTD